MDRARLLELVVTLGCEFSRRGMREECRRLRLYFLAVRHGLAASAQHQVQLDWDEHLVLEWLRLLRIPPFEHHYEVRAESACDRCPYQPGRVVTKAVFPGGSKFECLQCGRQWLLLRATRPGDE
jgi:hypothetical protein